MWVKQISNITNLQSMDWQLPSKAIELLWTLALNEITSEILSFERVAILFHCVSVDKDDNFIHRDYRQINIGIQIHIFQLLLHVFTPFLVCVCMYFF